jgi:Tfp pilus assembly protein PilF
MNHARRDWHAYGVRLSLLQKPEKAVEAFRHAVRINPTEETFLYNLGTTLMRHGDAEEAGEFLAKAMNSEPFLARKYSQYAFYLSRRAGDTEGAKEYFKRAIAIDKDDSHLAVNYGEFLCLLGQNSEGISWLKKGLNRATDVLTVRALFDRYVFESGPQVVLRALHNRLQKGSRAFSWDLGPAVEFAKMHNFKNVEFLSALAKAAGGDAPLSSLDSFSTWKKFKGARTRRKPRGTTKETPA